MTIGHTIIGSGSQGVLVLPGWMGDYTVFNPMLPYLDTGSFTYAFVDYRGYELKARSIHVERQPLETDETWETLTFQAEGGTSQRSPEGPT